jgi:hypothetical protein
MAQSINLHSRGRKASAELFSPRGIGAIAIALATGFGMLSWVETRRESALRVQTAGDRSESERLQRLLTQLPKDAGQSDQLAAEERDIAALERVAGRLTAGVLGRAGSFTDSLKGLGRATTEGVWLTGIKLNQGSGRFALEGKALDAARVPALMAALGAQPQFAGTAFAALDIKRDEMRPDDAAIRFRITSMDALAAPPPRAAASAGAPQAANVPVPNAAAALTATRTRNKP